MKFTYFAPFDLNIDLAKEEIFYNGVYFAFNKVRKEVPLSFLKPFQLGKPTLHKNATLRYKYAWDAVFDELKKTGELEKILNQILTKEQWNKADESYF